jgi:hypothetical protein
MHNIQTMKKSIKKIVLAILLALLFVGAYKLIIEPHDHFRTINMVPKNALFVFEMDNPYATWTELKNSPVWGHLQKNKTFDEVYRKIHETNSLIQSNKFLFKALGKRRILVSIHPSGNKSTDALIVVDMKNLSKLNMAKKQLRGMDTKDLNISTRKYKDFEIFEVYDRENKEMLYISFVNNLLVLSYHHILLEQSLDQSYLPQLARDPRFIAISNELTGSGQVRFYVNFPEIHKRGLFSTNSSLSNTLANLYFSGWKLDFQDNNFNLEGFVNGNDSIPSFINAMNNNNPGGYSLYSLVPDRMFLMVHLSFKSFAKLIENLEENLKIQGLYKEYRKKREKLERFIEIDTDEHVVSWIGEEISIFNLQSKYKNQPPEYVLAISINNEKEAVRNLDFINAQMKNHTPVKFKSIEYKGTKISYLAATGLFKLFLGNYFSRLDKPYYMVYEKCLFISDHPQTLKDIVDDIGNKQTLNNWDEFQEFKNSQFKNPANISVFLALPVVNHYYGNQIFKGMSGRDSLFRDLPFFGIQLNNNQGLFKSHLAFNYRNNNIPKTLGLWPEKKEMPKELPAMAHFNTAIADASAIKENLTEIPAAPTDPFEVPNIPVLELSKGRHNEYYSDSSLKMEFAINHGLKDGHFVWYYRNGEIKLKGKYKDDAPTGTWRYFNENGELMEKKKMGD